MAPAELEGSAELEETPGVPAGICAVPAGFNWLEIVGLDGAKEADPCGFDTAWLAWLDETEPDCPGGVAACWLDTVGLDGAKEADPCGFDTAWLAWLDETEPDCPGGVTTCWLDTVGLDDTWDGTGAVVSVVPFPCVLLGERHPLVTSAAAPAGCEAPLPLALDQTWPADARFISTGSAARRRD
ncbi:MAG: hypothetical protein JO344_08840 [Planctomycetaceae bacterium]|nr:hypothetical protein [Planctomycetaceae bacterium]